MLLNEVWVALCLRVTYNWQIGVGLKFSTSKLQPVEGILNLKISCFHFYALL